MSRVSMSDLAIDIEEDISLGVLDFRRIAEKYDIPVSWVNQIWEQMCEQENELDDSTADAEALASAGWGTDEDYGSYDYE